MNSTHKFVLGVAALLVTLPAFADVTLLNVSYDPTRELYQDFNEIGRASCRERVS
jgi:sulfate transport system substrate-binding protein